MRLYLTAFLAIVCLCPIVASAQAEDDFVVVEAVRAEIDEIFENYMSSGGGVARMEAANEGVNRLITLGQDAVPYLSNELEQERVATYDFCSFALGLIGGEQARGALRAMVERADGQPGDAAKSLKAFAVWGLVLDGDVTAIDLIFTGRHRVAAVSMHRATSLTESAGLLTAPESAGRLIEWFEKLTDDPDRWRERRMIMEALGRTSQPESIPILVHTLLEGSENDRRHAATALSGLGSPESVAALVSVLDDENHAVRRTASRALAEIGAPEGKEKAMSALATEEDVFVRSSLYRLLAEISAPDALESLQKWSGHADPRDRRFLVAAIGQLADPATLPVLAEALMDKDNGVAIEAAIQLARNGDDDALDALSNSIPRTGLLVAHTGATLLAEKNRIPAADAISARLEPLLAMSSLDREQLLALERLTDALIALRHLPTLRSLDELLAGDLSTEMRALLEPRRDRLALIKRNGKKLRRWLESAAADDAELRRFAWRRIGELGTAAAAEELVAAFDGAELPGRFAIVNALAHTPVEVASPLLERVLLDKEFDTPANHQLRDAAGWSARQLGGESMIELLIKAAQRVEGSNPRLMIYAAQLDPERAIPLFDNLRKPRFRALGSSRGEEQVRLDWIQRRLERGRSIDEFDLPPFKLHVR